MKIAYFFIFLVTFISCHPKMSNLKNSQQKSIEEESLSYANEKFLRSGVKQPADVIKLNVWNYPFEELPMNLTFAKKLRYFELTSESELDLEHTKMIINGFNQLKEMHLINNSFTELPFDPDSLLELEMLDLWKQDNIKLPEVVFKLAQCNKLKMLTLYNLPYVRLPEAIKRLKNLESIGLGSDSIDYRQHFEVLSEIPTLEAITIYGYEKKELPEGLNKLSLKELHFLNSPQLDYQKTFEQANAFETLETLEVSRVEGFTVLPKNVRKFKKLKELILTELRTSESYEKSLNMDSLSEDLLHLPNIEVINLSSSDPNPLGFTPKKPKRIPDNIRTLKKLKKLNLDNNRHLDMSHLVDVLKDLAQLEELSLYYITFYNTTDEILPKEFGELKSLKKLNLGWMKKTILDSLEHLPPQLTHLELETTLLGKIPEVMLNQVKLLSLNLQNTGLTTIPSEISQLINLENLDLQDNELTELPAQIAALKKLKFLDLAGNPCAEDEAFQKQIKEWLPNTTIYFYE